MVGALFVAGLATHGVTAGLLLLVVAAVLGALSVAVWQHLPARGRPLRVLVIVIVVAIAFGKFVGF